MIYPWRARRSAALWIRTRPEGAQLCVWVQAHTVSALTLTHSLYTHSHTLTLIHSLSVGSFFCRYVCVCVCVCRYVCLDNWTSLGSCGAVILRKFGGTVT